MRKRAVRTPPAPEPRVVAPERSGYIDTSRRMFIDTAQGRYVDLSAPAPPVITARAFEQERARLLRAFGTTGENPGSFSCQGCSQCTGCMFCVDCRACYRCTHCTRCEDGSHLTHCEDCTSCHGCAYCVRSRHCTGSSYLVLCESCSDCTYCFGCVGLAKKDFHVLNVKYTKTEYFRIVKALRAELGV